MVVPFFVGGSLIAKGNNQNNYLQSKWNAAKIMIRWRYGNN